MSELPEGWVNAKLSDVTIPFETMNPTRLPDNNFEYIDIGSIDNQTQTIRDPKSILGRDAPSRARRVVHTGDVLFSTVRTYLKNIAMVPETLDGMLTSTGIAVLRPGQAVDGRYLFNWVKSDDFIATMSSAQDGTLYPAVADKDVAGALIPLPPLPEQKRIVAKVDGLTASIARARNELDRIPNLIDRYKQRLLALAFSGEFTASWRRETGTDGKSQNGLPFGWVLKSLGEIGEIQGGIQVGKKRPATAELVEVPYLRVANVQRGWLNLDEIKVLSVTPMERDKLLLEDGDILMNEGGDRDKLGRGWIWKGQIPICIHQNHVFRVRLNDRTFPPEYVSHYANENGQKYFFDQGTQTTNLASVSKRRVAALPVPIPPIEEAIEIVRLIDVSFGWLDRMAAEHSAATKLLPKLDSAILAEAFRGKLVQQDPSDEPARSLLDRIVAERAAASKIKRSRKTPSRKEPAKMNRNLEEVLNEAADWLPGQEAFRRCGMSDSANSDTIAALYAELRVLEKAGRLEIDSVFDEQGRKLFDRLKLKVA